MNHTLPTHLEKFIFNKNITFREYIQQALKDSEIKQYDYIFDTRNINGFVV